MLVSKIYLKWIAIPKDVQRFLMVAIIAFIAWETLYLMYLGPTRVIDDILTQFTGNLTRHMLDLLYSQVEFRIENGVSFIPMSDGQVLEGNSLVLMGEVPLIHIADSCNGLNMYALFLGFIIAFPSSISLKLGFGSVGLLALIGVNIARCVGLAILQIHHPDFTVFAHHYVFNVLTYAAVFGLWYWFTKKAAR